MTDVNNKYIHQSILQRIDVLVTKQRLAHAYLFYGAKGVGKTSTALAVAKRINCHQPLDAKPCETCSSCLKIENGYHPDVHILKKEEGVSIKIDDVRDFIQQTHLRPYEANKKIFILCDVDNMTSEAANSLLKTLEEPSANSLIILTTSVPEANLDTIRSRCQAIFFPRMSVNDLAQLLQSDYDIEHSQAMFLSRFSEGSLGNAILLVEKKIFDLKKNVIDQFIMSADATAFIKKVSGDREQTRYALDLLWSFYRDVLLCRIGQPSFSFIHQDRIVDVRALADKLSPEDLSDVLQEITKTMRMLKDNFNVKIGLSLIKEMI